MGWPESELDRKHIREAIMAAKTPDEFFDKHLTAFKNSWMEKSFWTVKNNPEFTWGDRHCYVQLPHHTKLSELIEKLQWRKNQWHKSAPEPEGMRHFWPKPNELFTHGCDDNKHYWSLWAKPRQIVYDMWEQNFGPVYGSSFGMGGLGLIQWPSKEGHKQKYLLLASIAGILSSCWIAVVDDIDVEVVNPYEEKTTENSI